MPLTNLICIVVLMAFQCLAFDHQQSFGERAFERLSGRRSRLAPRIVGGVPLQEGDWPWLVSLHYLLYHPFTAKTHTKHLCAGTIIAPNWILTAAHCFSDKVWAGLGSEALWDVVAGEYNQYTVDLGEQTRQIVAIHTTGNFSIMPFYQDIALLELKTPLKLGSPPDGVSVIPLANSDEFPAGSECEIAGWGQLASAPYGFGMHLPLVTSVTIVVDAKCKEDYDAIPDDHPIAEMFSALDETMVCAQKAEHDSCNGDSGGGLVCRSYPSGPPKLVGIVSIGMDCADPKFPGIYTRVSYYIDWITKVTGIPFGKLKTVTNI